MDKARLLTLLEEAIKIEESVIPLYSRHITNTLFLSGLQPPEADAIKKILNRLHDDSQNHRRMFTSLLKHVRESQTDVY